MGVRARRTSRTPAPGYAIQGFRGRSMYGSRGCVSGFGVAWHPECPVERADRRGVGPRPGRPFTGGDAFGRVLDLFDDGLHGVEVFVHLSGLLPLGELGVEAGRPGHRP